MDEKTWFWFCELTITYRFSYKYSNFSWNKIIYHDSKSLLLTILNVFNSEFTWWEKIDSGNWSISNSNKSFLGVNVDTGELVEVLKEGLVWSSHGEFNLGELGQDTKESHLGLSHHDCFVEGWTAFVSQHFYYNPNYILY